MRRLILGVGLLAVAITACSGTGVTSSQQAEATPTAKPTLKPWITPDPAVTLPPVVTPAPETTGRFGPGEIITVTEGGRDWANITIDKVEQLASYKTSDRYGSDDVPAKGNVYIQARVTYHALADGVDYNPFDWQVFVDGLAVDNYAFTMNGPEPTLDSGTLPKDRKAQGWLVYEVPASGEVLLSYGGGFTNEAPVFEVVLR